ncbi:hypothetical protein FS837_012756 [Tulasnella sp. UAMH 9824]|nr:hypothetical protein FS837_012756 [Tulasnella sp. UAMH 9824]
MVSFKFATLLATAALSVLPGAEAAKRGLAWPSEAVSAFNPNVFLPGGKVDWIYNWGLDKKAIFSSIPSYYGMQWGSGGIASLATKFQQTGSGYLLGFNEPDNGAIHWYGGWIDDFKAFINDAKKYNKPLYLTEFGLDWDQYATVDSWTQFLPLALSFLDNEPAVVKYAFFGAFYSNTAKDMLNANGQLTTVGKLYIS